MTAAPTPDSLRPGHLVGPWLVEGYAGRGTYGAVYRARRAGHPGSLPVALKLALFPHDPRFMREVGLLARMQHPAVPRLLDRGWWHASADEVHPYLVMEWIRGRTLYDWGQVHQPTPRQTLRVAAQVMWGLEALHRASGLHRDVKGDNILVEPEGRAVLTDFGSGTWAGAPPITEHLMAPGTQEYRSPEALRFQWKHWRDKEARYEACPADDLYALGVSMYRLVTGRYPPPGTDPAAREDALLAPLPPRILPQELNPQVMPEMGALIERLLAHEPEARAVARELAEAAERLAERAGPEADVPLLSPERPVPTRPVVVAVPAGLPSTPVAKPVRARVESQGHSWALWSVAVVAALALVGVSIEWMGRWPRPEWHGGAWAESLDGGTPQDAGTSGLGDSTPTTQVSSQGEPGALDAKAIADEMPEEPLPGQKRAPCRGVGEVEINGGCWRRLADNPPHCGDDAYQWKQGCYYPAREKGRPRTSKNPR
jgi:hypothetical protein